MSRTSPKWTASADTASARPKTVSASRTSTSGNASIARLPAARFPRAAAHTIAPASTGSASSEVGEARAHARGREHLRERPSSSAAAARSPGTSRRRR